MSELSVPSVQEMLQALVVAAMDDGLPFGAAGCWARGEMGLPVPKLPSGRDTALLRPPSPKQRTGLSAGDSYRQRMARSGL